MDKKYKSLYSILGTLFFWGLQTAMTTLAAQAPGPPPRAPLPPIPIKGDTTHTLSRHFSLSTSALKPVNDKGFIQRWLVLEPIKKDIARNNIFTDNYLRTTFTENNFSNDYSIIPMNNQFVTIGDQELKWYALDSKTFNFNLYHFSYAINQPKYGLVFWLVTVIESPQEIKNVRMTAGCNSASMWWLNGEEAMLLSGDRDMIVDNVTSSRLTLKKGRNIIRGVVINGPGMANFCARFVDEKGLPIKNLNIGQE